MAEQCHRCGGNLPASSGESPFCPHCGSPQLLLSLDYQSVETGGEQGGEAATTGAVPPPNPQRVEWKTAIRCAAVVAGVAGLLILGSAQVPLLSPLSSVWMMSGSLIALRLYQKRAPLAWMDAGVGARIGLVVGLSLAAVVGSATAIAGLVARFWLHALGSFDAEMTARTQEAILRSGNPIPSEMIGFLGSAEFRAGIMLTFFVCFVGFLLAMSTLGGAFAGILHARRRAAV